MCSYLTFSSRRRLLDKITLKDQGHKLEVCAHGCSALLHLD